ncbi:MAG: hypothetical protein ABI873_12110 [Marmoricola sp.]
MRLRSVVVALLALVLAGCGGTHSPSVGSADNRKPDVPVGAAPVGLAAGPDGDLWVVNTGDNTVNRIPPGATKPDLTVGVAGIPLRVAVGYDAVWVTSFEGNEVVRIDEATGKVTDHIDVGRGAEGVTAAFGSVWVVAQDAGRLVRIDPQHRRVTKRIDVGTGVRLVVAGNDALWLNDYPAGDVVRVDPRHGTVRRSGHVCAGPQDMVTTSRQVWVTCSLGNEVVVLDPATLRVVEHHPLAGTPDAIADGPDGTLLVVLQDGPTLATLDPANGLATKKTRLGKEPQLYDRANLDLAVVGDVAWVSSFRENVVHRIRAAAPPGRRR